MLETPQIIKNGNNYAVSYGNDNNIFVEFVEEALLNKFASDESGKSVFDDVILVRATTPGNKNTFVDKVAIRDPETGDWEYVQSNSGPSWMERFPQQWNQFKAKIEQTPAGYPVTECPFFTKAYALNLKSAKIYTLEQIADMPDTALEALGLDGRTVREKVKAFLAKGKD